MCNNKGARVEKFGDLKTLIKAEAFVADIFFNIVNFVVSLWHAANARIKKPQGLWFVLLSVPLLIAQSFWK